MTTELTFTKNMSVYASDDSKVGEIKHVVVEPTTSEITHLVIEQGFILTEDKVLPIEYIAKQDGRGLYLNRPSDNLELLDYEERYFVSRDDPNPVAVGENAEPQSVYYYPPTPYYGLGGYYWGLPASPVFDDLREVKVRNVPEGTLVIEEGADVYSSDGDHVGDVYSVHVDSETKRITHFVISQGLIFHDYKLIPVFWVSNANDERITVAVTTKQMKKLPSFKPQTA